MRAALLSLLALLALLPSFSYADLSCSVDSSPAGSSGVTFLKIEKADGGSAELASQGNYSRYVNCEDTRGGSLFTGASGSLLSADLKINSNDGPVSLSQNQQVIVSWRTNGFNASSAACYFEANSAIPGLGQSAVSGSQPVVFNITLPSSVALSINCFNGPRNASPSASDSAVINFFSADSVPTIAAQLSADNGTNIVSAPFGSYVNISWSSNNATRCTSTAPGVPANLAPSGSALAGPFNYSRTVALTCSNNFTSASDSVTVNVAASSTAVLRLNRETNAHVQSGRLTDFPIPAFLGSSRDVITCDYRESCTGFQTCVASLSSQDNAHIAACNQLPVQVCCSIGRVNITAPSAANITNPNRTITTIETDNETITILNTGKLCESSCEDALRGKIITNGTANSFVSTEYSGGPTFTATITFYASGGGGYAGAVDIYDSSGTYLRQPISSSNICTSGRMTRTVQLPVNDSYTYEIRRAFCVRSDACFGCGWDVITAKGGPFGCPNCVDNGTVCSGLDTLPVSACTYKASLKELATDDEGVVTLNNSVYDEVISHDALTCPFVCSDTKNRGKASACRQQQSLDTDITRFLVYNETNYVNLSVADKGDYSRSIRAVFEIRAKKMADPESQYCIAGNIFNWCSNTDTSCGKRTCVNCNAQDGGQLTGRKQYRCINSTLTIMKEQEIRDYGCSASACDYAVRDRVFVEPEEAGSCNFNVSVSLSRTIVKANASVTVETTAVSERNITLECRTAESALLCRSLPVASNPSCSFTSPWTDSGNKTVWCTVSENTSLSALNFSLTSIPLRLISDNTPPVVSVSGAPETFQENSTLANVTCSDNAGCDTGSFRLLVSNEQISACPANYTMYDSMAFRNISRRLFVCGAAMDIAGNPAFSEPQDFKVIGRDLPVTNITSPPNGSVKGVAFHVNITDGGVGQDRILACEYRVRNNGAVTRDWSTRDCNSAVTVPVPVVCDTGSCIVEARAIDILGREGYDSRAEYIIDKSVPQVAFLSPAPGSWQRSNFTVSISDSFTHGISSCEYRVLSSGAEVFGFRPRNCTSPITVSTAQCRDNGANTCTVEARAAGATGTVGAASARYSIDLSGNSYDFAALTNARYEQTDTGVNFSGSLLTVITFPTFIVCAAGTSIEDCRSSYSVSSQNCGVDKPCLCGSLSSLSCDLRCNDLNSSYYMVVKGFSAFAEKTAVSPANSFACPSFRLGEINAVIQDFVELSFRGEIIRQQLTYLIDNAASGRDAYENTRRKVELGLFIIREHLSYINQTIPSLSVSRANEIIERSVDIKERVLALIFSSGVSIGNSSAPAADIKVNGVDAVSIGRGSSVTASWTSRNVDLCALESRDAGNNIILQRAAVQTSGTLGIGPFGESGTVTLACSGSGGDAIDAAIVNVNTTVTADIKIDGSDSPVQVARGSSVAAAWTSGNANRCRIEARDAGNVFVFARDVSASGSASVGPFNASGIITLACTGNGTALDAIAVNVAAAGSAMLPDELILNSNASITVPVENSGGNIYAKVECEFKSQSITKRSSACLFVASNSTRLFSVPVDTSTGRAMNVSCSVFTSAGSDCSSPALSDFVSMGSIRVRPAALNFTSIETPQNITAGDQAIISAEVKNSDIKDQKAYINCTFVDPLGDRFYSSTDSQVLRSQERKTFFAKLEARTKGRWVAESCAIYNDRPVPFVESRADIGRPFSVAEKTSVSECSVNLNCPGTDARCYCSSGSCQACSAGTRCVNHQCLRLECTQDSGCAAGKACQNSRCVDTTISVQPPPDVQKPVLISPLAILLIAFIFAIPAAIYIYFKRIAR